MRLIIAADSHGEDWALYEAVRAQMEGRDGSAVEALLFLGDGENDLELVRRLYPRLRIIAVRGNWDGLYGDLPETDTAQFGGIKILLTHGHRYGVKQGMEEYERAAREHGAQLALFGHTHRAEKYFKDGIWLFNPGSVREGSYGVADISPAGLFCFNCKI